MILKRLNFLYAKKKKNSSKFYASKNVYTSFKLQNIYKSEKVTFIVIISSKNCLASHETLTINTIKIQYSTITIIIVLIIIKMQNRLQCIIETTYLSLFQNSEAQNPSSDLIILQAVIYIYIKPVESWKEVRLTSPPPVRLTDHPDRTPEQQTEVKLHKYFIRQTAVASMPYANHLNTDTGWSPTLTHTHTLLNTRS